MIKLNSENQTWLCLNLNHFLMKIENVVNTVIASLNRQLHNNGEMFNLFLFQSNWCRRVLNKELILIYIIYPFIPIRRIQQFSNSLSIHPFFFLVFVFLFNIPFKQRAPNRKSFTNSKLIHQRKRITRR